MDYAALKTADAALGIADLSAAAAALNAQTNSTLVDIGTSDARAVLLLSGEWYAIGQLAAQQQSGTSPPTTKDQAIAVAAVCIATLTLTDMIHTSNPNQWTRIQSMCGALVSAGVMSQASFNTWTAMRTANLPVWPQTITPGHIQTARAQP